METIKKGKYGGSIHTRNDGDGFDVYFLYNIGEATHQNSTGDVWFRKTYKSKKTAISKINTYIEAQQA